MPNLTNDQTPTIELPAGALQYGPMCLLVATGQTVTFVGSFSAHPLNAPGCGAGFIPQTGGAHGNSSGVGMAGTIQVVAP